ncbi:hypothetical protein F3F96_07275 [Mariprofundus sp. NF]|uniref:hypothetical protein n=1 Tax=Mariprofundus sp. NF TaxID=2608716 RepID=UPI0015A28CD7|nr:hypothetical protein [Mariprofundus sp. NF]NWF38935.1 hypothetical protein [Mariprofundus sp. NF]
MNRNRLEAAAKQGIISREQVEALLNFLDSEKSVSDDDHSEDHMKFVRGFGDVFITLGIVFVAVASAQINMISLLNIIPLVLLIATTEWLVRGRRLVLPGIALLISSLYFASQLIELSMADYGLLNLLFLTALAGLFYWRYKIPFTLLPIALGCIAMISVIIEIDLFHAQYVFIIYGLSVFAAAMWFDARDINRKTRFSDAAFWLHLLAAPLVVHGVMVTLLASTGPLPFKEVLIIAFFIAFFLVALYVDRRALLVSSLSYAIYAVIALSKSNAFAIENLTLLIFAAFGAFIIFFGTYWYKIRSFVYAKTAGFVLSRYVPPFIDHS